MYCTGCVQAELNAGYYYPTGSKGDDAPATLAEPELEGHWGAGIGIGTYYDFMGGKLHTAVSGAGDYLFISDPESKDGHVSLAGGQLRVDYALTGDVVASLMGHYGNGTLAHGSEEGRKATSFGGFAGVGLRQGDADGFGMAAVGLRYVAVAADDQASGRLGKFSAWGPEVRLTLGSNWGSGSSGSDSGGGGGGGGNAGLSFDLPSSNDILPALAHAARRKGCQVQVEDAGIIAKCSEGNIGYIQDGSRLVAICSNNLDNDGCRTLHRSVLDNAEVSQ